jgi:hypothetical protein
VAMKHVNEDLPDVQSMRADVSAAAALVVERATNKEPAKRYQRVEEMVDDLQTALEVEAARAGSTTGEATSVLDALPAPKRKLSVRRRPNLLAILLGVLVIAIVLSLVYGISKGWFGSGGGGAEKKPNGTPVAKISIKSSSDFDPEGDGSEHSPQVGLVHDNNPTNTGGAWSTETYPAGLAGAPKEGVGIYVDTGKPVVAKLMSVISGKSGWDAEVYGARTLPPVAQERSSGITDNTEALAGWELIGKKSNMPTHAEIDINARSSPFRYYLLWITKVTSSGNVEIFDIHLTG